MQHLFEVREQIKKDSFPLAPVGLADNICRHSRQQTVFPAEPSHWP